MWDPDAGLVIPRSQTVAGKLVDAGEKTGKLKVFANTPAQSLIVENGRIKGVVTHRGTIMADHVVVCAGLWGRQIAEMVGEDLPVMPVDHPLTFFGPYNEFEGTGKDIGFPLLRDQGNSAYMRDTGDPTTAEGGQIEWGYYETDNPAAVPSARHPGKEQARLSPSQRDLDMEQIIEPLERAMELTPILANSVTMKAIPSTACCRSPPPAGRPAARARRCAGFGTASPSGSRTGRATAS
jgi:glycine/D-amino acid oxidase-like deaminating enzyme